MFWGHLNQQDGCTGTPVAIYMFTVLILGFATICCNCCGPKGLQSQWSKSNDIVKNKIILAET